MHQDIVPRPEETASMPNLLLNNHAALHYEWLRPAAGDAAKRPVLVFLHEGLGSCRMWRQFPQQLVDAVGCDGLMYDRQGYGLSDALTSKRTVHYLHEYALNELPQVLQHLVAGRPYIVIGHSDGGSIGLLHAAAQPDGLLGLVTLGVHVYVEPETLAGIRAARKAWDAGKLVGLARYHGDKTEAVFLAWSDTWLAPTFAAWNIEYALPSVACPTLMLQGENDQYATIQHLHAIRDQVQQGTAMWLPECGHSPHLDRTEHMVQTIADWIRPLTV